MTKPNVCITGYARNGKDTVGKRLADILGYDTYYLAKPIKDIMCALFNWGDEHRDGSYKEIPMMQAITPDQLDNAAIIYNSYGLDKYEEFHDCWDKLVILLKIEIDPDGLGRCIISPRVAFQLFGTEWGRKLNDKIWLEIAPKYGTVITDIRFDNEAEYFIAFNASLVKVARPGFKPVDNGHESENGVSEYLIDFFILNDGTLNELLEKTDKLVSSLTKYNL